MNMIQWYLLKELKKYWMYDKFRKVQWVLFILTFLTFLNVLKFLYCEQRFIHNRNYGFDVCYNTGKYSEGKAEFFLY